MFIPTDVSGGSEPEAADEAGAEVRDDVAVEVGHHHHVEVLRLLDELHHGAVDDHLLILDRRVLVCGGCLRAERASGACCRQRGGAGLEGRCDDGRKGGEARRRLLCSTPGRGHR